MRNLKRALALICLLLPISIVAQQQETTPINVSSDKQSMDGLNNTALFNDNVLVTQGDMTIKADFLKVVERDGKGTELFIANGLPAVFTTKVQQKPVSAKANAITYDAVNRLVVFEGNAELNQDGSLVRGERIEYQIDKQKLIAEKKPQGDQRVTTIFLPEKKAETTKDTP